MKTIAIIHLGYIGDVINSSPVCLELKRNYPDAKIIFITIPQSLETAKCLPGIDKVLIYDKKDAHKGLFNLLKIVKSFGIKEKIDLAVILNESIRSAFLAFLLGAKIRTGRDSQLRGFLLTHKIPHTKEEQDMRIHVSEHYMRVLRPIGLYNQDYAFGFNYSQDDIDYIDSLLSENNALNKEIVGLCPCARFEDKNWDADEAVKFINYINTNDNRRVLLVGSKSTSGFAEEIRKRGIDNFIDLSCKTSVSQLAALISRFKVLITTDTGPAHLAYTLKIPTVTLFYHNVPEKWGPKSREINRVIVSPNKSVISADSVIFELKDLFKDAFAD